MHNSLIIKFENFWIHGDKGEQMTLLFKINDILNYKYMDPKDIELIKAINDSVEKSDDITLALKDFMLYNNIPITDIAEKFKTNQQIHSDNLKLEFEINRDALNRTINYIDKKAPKKNKIISAFKKLSYSANKVINNFFRTQKIVSERDSKQFSHKNQPIHNMSSEIYNPTPAPQESKNNSMK